MTPIYKREADRHEFKRSGHGGPDEYAEALESCDLQIRQLGWVSAFEASIVTVRCHEDNAFLKQRSPSRAKAGSSSSSTARPAVPVSETRWLLWPSRTAGPGSSCPERYATSRLFANSPSESKPWGHAPDVLPRE
jgi:hypothetical protein